MEEQPGELGAEVASALDRAWQLALRTAFVVLQCYWRLLRPRTEGACVLAWHGGRLLMVRHSYRPGLGIPAGAPRFAEAPRATAVRELREEVGFAIDPRALERLGCLESRAECKRDFLTLFEVELRERPRVRVDQREVVWADFEDPRAHAASAMLPSMPAILARSRIYARTIARRRPPSATPVRGGRT